MFDLELLENDNKVDLRTLHEHLGIGGRFRSLSLMDLKKDMIMNVLNKLQAKQYHMNTCVPSTWLKSCV